MQRRKFLTQLLAMATLPVLWPWRSLARMRPAAAPVITRMAFGSCAEQDRPQPIWDVIAQARPDLFAFIGDNIYADTEDLGLMAARYDELAAKPEFARFRSQVPIIATWDDHDYGINDGGAEYPSKQGSKDLFLDFFGEPADSPRRKQEGIYTSYVLGNSPRRLQVIVLDLRWFRSPLYSNPKGGYGANPDPNAVLLGEAQWAWLQEQLRMPADFRILVSSTQLVSEQHGWERWACYPREKARLLNMIDGMGIRNLMVISGDMHFGELSMEKTPGGFELYDFTSSGLTLAESAEEIPNDRRLALDDRNRNFGLIDIDWDAKPLRVKLRLGNGDGGISFSRDLTFG